ncbi:hypothetical protein PanWU01x14_090390 [Parasponia andersonii]|uniref:Uncharacterized protein n=1 Tax=Parasponia andersonii TaxID=3476 RepID=A0A2P5D7U8_PARAD|nr:hypothetical protein PanWU01x14_090390 [Parasponia andersonii]
MLLIFLRTSWGRKNGSLQFRHIHFYKFKNFIQRPPASDEKITIFFLTGKLDTERNNENKLKYMNRLMVFNKFNRLQNFPPKASIVQTTLVILPLRILHGTNEE